MDELCFNCFHRRWGLTRPGAKEGQSVTPLICRHRRVLKARAEGQREYRCEDARSNINLCGPHAVLHKPRAEEKV